MVLPSILIQMAMRHTTNKGFGLLDMLIVLFIVTSMMLVALTKYRTPDFDYIYLTNDILDAHINSLVNKENSNVSGQDIYFNENGNINKAKTITFNNHSIILHLGNGYLVYE